MPPLLGVAARTPAIDRLDSRRVWAPLALTPEQTAAEEVAVFSLDTDNVAAVFRVDRWQEVSVRGSVLYVPQIASSDFPVDAEPLPVWFWAAVNQHALGSRVALSCHPEAEAHTHTAEVVLTAPYDPAALAALVRECAEGSQANRARPDWLATAAAMAECVHWCPLLAEGRPCPDCPGPSRDHLR